MDLGESSSSRCVISGDVPLLIVQGTHLCLQLRRNLGHPVGSGSGGGSWYRRRCGWMDTQKTKQSDLYPTILRHPGD